MNAFTEFQAPATLRALRDIVAEYDEKHEAADQVVADFESAVKAVNMAAGIGGTYGGSAWGRGSPSLYARDIRDCLLKSAWHHVYDGLQIKHVAPAGDRKKFDLAMQNPAPFTLENIRATFGDYIADPRFHILRGLAECFIDLDPAYKSHSKMKIGVAGLPKRIIISGAMGQFSYGTHGREKLQDVINALRTYRGEPHIEHAEYEAIVKEARATGKAKWDGGTVKAFMNGNAHLMFNPETLREVNLALAEFYGDILPDIDEDEGDLFKRPGTDVSKDLQFYWTPAEVVAKLAEHLDYSGCGDDAPLQVLEPSCGDGRIMDGLKAWSEERLDYGRNRPRLNMTGIEYHAGRASEARAKGHKVLTGNFLDQPADPRFDVVVMNPPFYGTHWKQHLDHARKFLRQRAEGQRFRPNFVICVLPASACYDGHLEYLGIKGDEGNSWRMRDKGWHDLPVASFRESGTNVPTGYLVIGGAA